VKQASESKMMKHDETRDLRPREDYHGISLVPNELDKSRRRIQAGAGIKPDEVGLSS